MARHSSSTILGLGFVAAAILAVGWASCAPDRSGTGPTVSAPFGSVDEAPRAAVLAYARGLDFVTTDGAADTRPLSPTCLGCPSGPVITVQPERGSYLLSPEKLADGRILARLINQDRTAAPSFGLEPGDTSYWWVDKAEGRWRSVLIPSREATPLVVMGMLLREHRDIVWRQALARIVPIRVDVAAPGDVSLSGADSTDLGRGIRTMDGVWTACDSLYCCNTRPK